VQAGFTLLYAVLSLSSSNLNVYEVFIGDAISLGFWIAVLCRMALLIAKTGTFGSCAAISEASGRNSCAASQIVLALAVDLRWGPCSILQVRIGGHGRVESLKWGCEKEIIRCGTFEYFFSNNMRPFNSVLSLTRIIVAFFVRRRGPSTPPDLDDCEKLYATSE